MKDHNLMQAIARVNRVYKDKPSGLVVDYLGIASDLQQALAFYAQSGGRGDPLVAQGEAVVMLEEWLEIARQMFHGFAYQPYFQADTRDKLRLILAAQNFILGLENGQKRFIDIITALSRVLVIAMPHEAALAVKEEVAFFQAIKARLTKFETTGLGKSNEELETAIRQVIDGALVSQQVIDVFDAAGLKKPDMSILSEEFLTEIKGMAHQNLALEVLKKLLHDELKGRAKKNLVQSQSLMELLEQAIRRYHNKIITAVEVIEELIALSKEIQARDNEAANLGMTEFEYAFYTAVANNDSAREMMQHEKLRALAVVLTHKVRENASIDWTLKESVRAKLKVMVKRTLREFGYPPDMELLATETVLKQAEAMAAELTATGRGYNR